MVQGTVLPHNDLYKQLSNRLDERFMGDKAFARVNQIDIIDSFGITSEKARYLPPSSLNSFLYMAYSDRYPDHYISVGSNSFTDMTIHTKFLGQWPYLYSEVATEYVRLCCEVSGYNPRPRKRRDELSGPPGYFMGYAEGNLSYIDIQACYFQLWSPTGIDLGYSRDELSDCTAPFIHADLFGEHKGIRNTCFGLFNHRRGTAIKHGKFIQSRQWTFTQQPDLAAYVFDTITAIAQDAISRFDIHAWITDAAILPTSQADDFIGFLWEDWGMVAVRKAQGNHASVYNLNSHSIGDKVTQDIRRGKRPQRGAPVRELPRTVDVLTLKRLRKELLYNEGGEAFSDKKELAFTN